MRVCIVTPEFPLESSSGRGGVGTYSENLARGLLSREVEVYVVIYGERALTAPLRSALPVHLHFAHLPWVPYFSSLFPGLWQSFRLWLFLRKLDRQYRFDVFEMYNDEGLTLFSVMGFKRRTAFRMHTSIRQHIVHKGETFNRSRNFSVWLDRVAARAARHLVTHSAFHSAEMATEYGLDPDRFVVIPHCTKDVAEPRDEPSGSVVGFIGSLDRRKGIDVLLQAAPAILTACPSATILVVGRDTGFSKDTSWAAWFEKTLGPEPRVRFAGPVGDAEMERLWDSISILVVPSRYESFGLTVIEGFSRRKAVVTTRAAALPEVAKQGAVMTEQGDPGGLADAVIDLLRDPSAATLQAARGYRTYLDFYTLDIFADRIVRLYRSIAA
jgi:glycosyltransferase involved in cell wall biosynthesis